LREAAARRNFYFDYRRTHCRNLSDPATQLLNDAKKGKGKKKQAPMIRDLLNGLVERLDLYDIGCLGALGRFDDVELHLLAFSKRLEAAVLNVAEVNEHVCAIFTGNEAKTLGIIEPLHGSCNHGVLPPSLILKMTERFKTKNRKDEKSLRFPNKQLPKLLKRIMPLRRREVKRYYCYFSGVMRFSSGPVDEI
jgi:hypothetical protein